jgi:hypothetical protein
LCFSYLEEVGAKLKVFFKGLLPLNVEDLKKTGCHLCPFILV